MTGKDDDDDNALNAVSRLVDAVCTSDMIIFSEEIMYRVF